MSSSHYSPFTRRFRQKALDIGLGYKPTYKEMAILQHAFAAALKEELASRWAIHDSRSAVDMTIADKAHPLYQRALVIQGLGSFKMRTRPAREFERPHANALNTKIMKPAARRLVFTAKWEEIK